MPRPRRTLSAFPNTRSVLLLIAGWCSLFLIWEAGTWESFAEPPIFHRQTWTTEHGLPANHVTALRQTRDGYLWIGTHFGLVKFDGVQFTTFNQGNTKTMLESSDAITALVETSDGTLCIGTPRGLLTLKDRKFTAYNTIKGLPHPSILSLGPASDGGVWVGTHHGLGHFRNGFCRAITNANVATTAIDSVLETQHGEVLAGTRRGFVRFRLRDEEHAEMLHRIPSAGFITRIAEDAQGRVWFNQVGTNVIYRIENSQILAEPLPANPGERNAHGKEILITGAGVVVLTSRGACILKQADARLEPLWELDAEPDCALPNSDGTIWVGTKESGLVRLAQQTFHSFVPPTPKLANIWTVSSSTNNDVWLGTDGGVIRLSEGELLSVPFAAAPEDEMPVHSIFVDRENNVWAGRGGVGVWKYNGKTMVQQFTNVSLPHSWRISAIAQGPDGRIWFGTDSGLYGSERGSLVQLHLPNLPRESIREITPVRDGSIWLGTCGGGVCRMSNNQITTFTTTDGLANNKVYVIFEDESGRLWIGTENGLSLYSNNAWFTFRTQQGLFDNVINHIEEDAFGRLWFSCNRGVYWMEKTTLLEVAAGKRNRANHVVYGEGDGMVTSETNGEHQPAGTKDSMGRIWFPTRRGVVRVDPASIPTVLQPPKVVVETVKADGEIAYYDSHSPLSSGLVLFNRTGSDAFRLASGRGRFLEISFTAPVFEMAGKTRFEYRLDGQDNQWLDAGARRNVQYSNLRPGHYQFRVRACTNRGLCNEIGAAIGFTLQPHFSQTWWFQGLSAATAITLCVCIILYRLRVQKRFLALERDTALEHQRSRIAQDMHDELGASLTKIAILGEVAKRELERKLPAEAHLNSIAETAREAVDGLGQIVWTTNPANDTFESLFAYLREYAGEFFDRTSIECSFEFPMEIPLSPVTAELRRNIFLAAKEIMTNVVRHSEATQVVIRLKVESKRNTLLGFALEITDNGRGFNPEHLPRFSNGITSVRTRIASLGGTVNIFSEACRGTTVRIGVATHDKGKSA
jgi:ligand-binding sensor domain-containing protein/signal transduction histidine kinase